MECNNIKELIIDYMDGSLDKKEAEKVDSHLLSCEECRTELEAIKSIWFDLDDLKMEKVSDQLKKNIDSMIGSYILGMKNTKDEKWHVSFVKWLESWWPRRPVIQLASTMALLIIGLITGFSIGSKTESKNEIVQLKSDVNQLQQVVMSSILDQNSVTERIRGLSMTGMVKNTDKEFYSTLLLILNSDSNVNVRMAAVNALSNFTGNEYVRRELVKSLGLQSSPLVQVSLIDLLATIKEPEASSALINIINDSEVNMHVKERAKKALKQFI
ncbi:MAG: hypothetical protein GX654_20745 [Desulfatiglans sp.]|jgi:hypothetical protein|nr:hypothetical protein [Desulfatiglans sp.]